MKKSQVFEGKKEKKKRKKGKKEKKNVNKNTNGIKLPVNPGPAEGSVTVLLRPACARSPSAYVSWEEA